MTTTITSTPGTPGILSPLSPLSTNQILPLRDQYGAQVDVEVVAETGSTNADLMARLGDLQAPLLRIAERQTAGRGRAGRVWHSAPGGVLTFSLAWRFKRGVQAGSAQSLSGLPLAVGTAVAEVLLSLGVPVQLKWPNDILKDKKKLAGILIETASTNDDAMWAVIGIGLNLRVPEALEAEIGQAVADAPWLAQMDRNLLMAHLLNALAKALEQFQQHGFSAFAARWNALHAYAQQNVLILDGGEQRHAGIALGVDATGCLVLQTEQGQVTVVAGDVSLRPVP
ncbi:biotin--[acetyl-CoA-carboxylase] ligase [Undibacterium sp. RTI2.1]|uniref:biotin--[acetyl-CoA-carboxylase] ligase n=1 Tax=unclassified Undibacterium TaxID=2630295 RepID=UPI002B22A130|nr:MULTISPECIES: biotin--[acetyl-CoA-carboxylase] ligase [unclassified Undibacterium]MEB0031872.1 biotin--[acetyl-CoA-carboxylase] ligase [Undibacterium sp. RTI2.1]MEB0118152.1 biotin--[acetyl-CoA-carboxylase] ligase [Undibacterium sp. RTI2.2]